MKIGIDATCWWNSRGFGRVTRELLPAMFELPSNHQFRLFVDQVPHEAMNRHNTRVIPVVPNRPVTSAAIAGDRRSLADLYRLYSAVSKNPVDVMFFPAVYSWFPTPHSQRSVVTIHDAIPEHFPKQVFPGWKDRFFWKLKVRLALWQSERVMTVSNAAKAEIIEYIKVPESRIDVINEAPSEIFIKTDDSTLHGRTRKKYRIPIDKRMIIYVGGFAPYKNLAAFLEAFGDATQNAALSDVHLILVGDQDSAGFHSNQASLQRRIRDSPGLAERVHFTGYVPDEDLVALYNDALAAAMPSYSEGFGLPAIEAMACGTPVLSSNRGALPEVVGDTGLYFDPCDRGAMTRAIIDMATEPALRDELAERALRRASTFTWEKAAKSALAHIEAAAPSG